VRENRSHHDGVFDQRDDTHRAFALGAFERVRFIDLADQPRPGGLGAAMPGKVLLMHGDTHQYRDDEPLPGLRRVEVYGSPSVRWARARIERAGVRLFDVELVRE
jgi:hypothetical protein